MAGQYHYRTIDRTADVLGTILHCAHLTMAVPQAGEHVSGIGIANGDNQDATIRIGLAKKAQPNHPLGNKETQSNCQLEKNGIPD